MVYKDLRIEKGNEKLEVFLNEQKILLIEVNGEVIELFQADVKELIEHLNVLLNKVIPF